MVLTCFHLSNNLERKLLKYALKTAKRHLWYLSEANIEVDFPDECNTLEN